MWLPIIAGDGSAAVAAAAKLPHSTTLTKIDMAVSSPFPSHTNLCSLREAVDGGGKEV